MLDLPHRCSPRNKTDVQCLFSRRSLPQLDDWLAEITETLAAYNTKHPDRPAAPFAVNQIVHKSNARLEQDMAVCIKCDTSPAFQSCV